MTLTNYINKSLSQTGVRVTAINTTPLHGKSTTVKDTEGFLDDIVEMTTRTEQAKVYLTGNTTKLTSKQLENLATRIEHTFNTTVEWKF